MQEWHRSRRIWQGLLVSLMVVGFAIAIAFHPLPAGSQLPTQINVERLPSNQTALSESVPALQPHALPPLLAAWRDLQQSGDYFDQVRQTSVGYLVWSRFPVTVYIQPPTTADAANPASLQRSQAWVDAIAQAVQAWSQYLPLERVNQANGADITVLRSPPPLRLAKDPQLSDQTVSGIPNQRRLTLGRARSAETRFELYAQPILPQNQTQKQTRLAHRFTILLRPDQAPEYLQAAARHELGHAIGIWGHSQLQTDALYFSQVRTPLPISARDVNTLKRVYEQPTRLGWVMLK